MPRAPLEQQLPAERGPWLPPPSTSALAELFSAAGPKGAGAATLNLQGAGEPSQRQEGSWDHPAVLLHCGEAAGNQPQSEPPSCPLAAKPSCAAGALGSASAVRLWCIWHPSAQADAGQLPLRALQCRGLRGAGVSGMQLPASSELSINHPHDEPGTCTPLFPPLRSRETLP